MTKEQIAVIIVSAFLGGGGIIGLAFTFLKKAIEKRLDTAECEAKRRRDTKQKRMQIEDELHHAYGRLFFWLYRAVCTGRHNGELNAAFKALEAAEEKKKNLDREIIAESE